MDEISIVKLLYDLQKLGIVLWCADGEKLRYSCSDPIPSHIIEKIKTNKHDLIDFLVVRKIVGPYQIPYLFAVNLTEYPLSPAQERLWFLAQLQEKDNYIYNEPITLTFDGQCNLAKLTKTLQILIERHACFRTLFKKDVNGIPKQVILSPQDSRVKSIYTLGIQSIADENLSTQLAKNLKSVFDLSAELAIRCDLYHLNSSNQYVLYIIQHHIITDGTSITFFLGEFYTIYNNLLNKQPVNLANIDIQYVDYALWFKEYYKKDNLVKELSYWKNKLAGFETLQIQKDGHKTSAYRSLTHKYPIDLKLMNDLKLLAKKNQTTLFVALLAASYILFNRYSNQNDIVIGTPINGRNQQQVKNILGFFINAIVLRAKLNNQRVCDLLADINQLYLEGLKYQELPFEILVDSMDINRTEDLSPIFQVCLAYQKFIIPGAKADNTSWFDNSTTDAATKFDITFDFKETDHKLLASIQYKANLFLAETIARMSNHYVNILRQIVLFPERNINDLHVLSKDEYENIVYKWNSTKIPYSKNKSISQLFEAQVLENPNNIAAIYADSQLTYLQLNEKANKLANYIRLCYLNYYKTALDAETLIVISMENSLELVVTILAVIKAGAAYVPIDVNSPEQRKCFLLEDINAKLIITKECYYADFNKVVDQSEKILTLEKSLQIENLSGENLQQFAIPSSTVYIIYTSGSTGTPKGVCTTHLSLNNFISSIATKFNITSKKKILTVSSFTFDMFCFDFFSSLCLGGTLILTNSQMVREPDALVNYIEDHQPDIIMATPSLWHMIIDKLKPTKLTIISAGEPLHENLAQKLFEKSTDVWDAYGPTETTIVSIVKRLFPGEKFAIGKPIPNVTAYILNSNLQPVPIGVVGELYIGGDCLAKGYLNRPDLTKERFIANPFSSAAEKSQQTNLKIYKTGDLGYWLPSGDIKYVGRNDFQVKISGHRIELEELEFVLNQLPTIKQSLVLATESGMSKQLVVYYTAESKINENILRDYLGKSLPGFMIPHIFIYLEKFPLNNNGKIDIKNLPKINEVVLNENIILPRNSIEKDLSKIIANILNLDSIGVDKDIFDIGCDSLKAVQIQTKINQHFNATIKVVDIFYYPSVEKLALHLNNEVLETENPYHSIPSVNIAKKDDIAIIGYSCLFPMCDNVEEYWSNIKQGKECVRKLAREECVQRGVSLDVLNHQQYSPYAGVVSNIEMFDAEFWGLSERDAFFMDPKMRLFLQQAWKAIESSGYIKKRQQISMGMFASFGKLHYLERLLQLENIKQTINYFEHEMLCSNDYFLNRIAYLLGISGPLLSVDTACSSASVAIIEACEKLLAGKCELALVGGVNLCSADDFGHISFEGMELLSKDGHSRIFDEKSGGIIRSDGVGVVVLKRLSEAMQDKDHIRAVIKSYGISQDGMRRFGNMYPRLSSLKKCIADAQQNLPAANIDYVECHGMGFKLGELFEFDALSEAFNHRGPYDNIDKCILGSVKANIGHTGYASGMAQLIKITCMLEHGVFPAQINYDKPYAEFNLDNTPFQINKQQHTWQKDQDKLKTAGMTSFGIGGTSVHILVEEALKVNAGNDKAASSFLIALSAKSHKSLLQTRDNITSYLISHSELCMVNVAYTLHLAREEFSHRLAFVCHDIDSCIKLLQSNYLAIEPRDINSSTSAEKKPRFLFNYSNINDNFTSLSKSLYESEWVYRNEVDQCAALLEKFIGVDIRQAMGDKINNDATILTCISLVHSYAISRFLSVAGLEAQVIVGEGIGEYLAACVRNLISIEQMLQLFLIRAMIITGLDREVFTQSLQKTQVTQSKLSCLSLTTGKEISIESLLNSLNTQDNSNNRHAVAEKMTQLISPDFICITFSKDKQSDNLPQQVKNSELTIYNNTNEVDDYAYILNIIAKLWLQGVEINWQVLYSDKTATVIDLPTYSFAKLSINMPQEIKSYTGEVIATA